jgi:hypothetical protein
MRCALVIATLACCGVLAARAGTEPAAERMKIRVAQGSVLSLSGTSTLHDFESRSDHVTVALLRDASTPDPQDAAAFKSLIASAAVRGVDVEVPVTSLRSDKSGLDKNLWRALQAPDHPTIRFHLAKYTITSAASPDTLPIRAEGTLEVAGVVKPVTLQARAIRAANGLWLEGSQPLLMSDFGIRPPKMMLGTLRVGDRILVHYHLLLVPGDGSTSSATPIH